MNKYIFYIIFNIPVITGNTGSYIKNYRITGIVHFVNFCTPYYQCSPFLLEKKYENMKLDHTFLFKSKSEMYVYSR